MAKPISNTANDQKPATPSARKNITVPMEDPRSQIPEKMNFQKKVREVDNLILNSFIGNGTVTRKVPNEPGGQVCF